MGNGCAAMGNWLRQQKAISKGQLVNDRNRQLATPAIPCNKQGHVGKRQYEKSKIKGTKNKTQLIKKIKKGRSLCIKSSKHYC